jgi:hypothetical protein
MKASEHRIAKRSAPSFVSGICSTPEKIPFALAADDEHPCTLGLFVDPETR